MNTSKDSMSFSKKFILLPFLMLVFSVSLLSPQQTQAQSVGSAAASSVASGLASCAAQIGGTIAGSAAASFASSKLINIADVTNVPTGDAGTQSANLTNNIVRTARETCLDTIAYNVAKDILNQLHRSTVKWIESGFTKFGQSGNKAFVGNVDNFLSSVGQQTFNRFMSEIGTGNSPISQVCGAFNEDVLQSVGRNYFEENPNPAGISFDEDLVTSSASNLSDDAGCGIGIGQDSLESFINGDFQEGGWDAYYHTVENPNANPVGAYLEQKEGLRQRIEQARNTNLTELQNNGGWISEVACPNGSLDKSTNSCVDGDGNTLSEPTIKTPGNIVNEAINSTIDSNSRRLELADEVNEIVGALADQLVSQVIGQGTGGGGSDDTKGLFSQAAQENPNALGNFSEAAEGDYGNQLQEEYVRNTLNDQVTLEQDLLTIVEDLPDTNNVARVEARINQCLNNTRFGEEKSEEVEEQLQTMTSAYNSAFPAAENAEQKEVGPQKIDWVGNDVDNWNYGDPQGLESCERFKDAFNVSYVPDRNTQSWEAYICVHKNGSQFNEKSNQFKGKFIELPSFVTDYFSFGPEDAPGDRPLYRNARNNKIKIDWKGDDLDWKHYDPLAYEYSSWVPEDRVELDDNEETHTGEVWMNKSPEDAQGIFETVEEFNEEVASSSSSTSTAATTTATTTVEEVIFQDSLSGHAPLPGPGIDDTEGEKFGRVPNRVGDTNRYGAKVCDERNLGALSYVVKPHDDVWTIQYCTVEAHNIEADSGGFFESTLGKIVTVTTGAVGGAIGYAIDYSSGQADAEHFRFADIPLTDYSKFTQYDTKPPAFREAQGAVDNKGQFISEINNLLGSTSSTPIDDSFTAPEFQSDNLREIQYDLDNVATSGVSQQKLSERQQNINDRFGRIEKRFHTEDDLSAASDALSVVNPSSTASVLNELKIVADNYSCSVPDGWEPPVGSTSTPPTSTPPTSTPPAPERPEITDFTVTRSGANNRFISIAWSATADECVAKNDSDFGQWSGPVSLSGSRIIRYDSAINVSLTCSKNGVEDSSSAQIGPAQPSPFEGIDNPRLE